MPEAGIWEVELMRSRTLNRKTAKEVTKAAEKQIKAIIKDFNDNKKDLMELFGLVVTQALNIKEFEEKEDFCATVTQLKIAYTKLKNDLGRLHSEIMHRKEEVVKMAMIKNHIAIMTRAKMLRKFEELVQKEKDYEKEIGKRLPTATDVGIPQQWIDFFNNIELVAECMKDYIDSETLTVKEKHYMRRYVTYATKYIKMIEDDY